MAKQHIDIKKLAEEMRSINGNHNINQTDMLWYLVKKIDDVDKRMDDICEKYVTKVSCTEKRAISNSGKAQAITIIALCLSTLFSIFNLFLILGGK
jgi:hypothetical protein